MISLSGKLSNIGILNKFPGIDNWGYYCPDINVCNVLYHYYIVYCGI